MIFAMETHCVFVEVKTECLLFRCAPCLKGLTLDIPVRDSKLKSHSLWKYNNSIPFHMIILLVAAISAIQLILLIGTVYSIK
jgi:hypothetical protein